jgi:hypothetical protein
VKDSIVVHFTEFNYASLGVLVQFNISLQTWAEEQKRKEEVFLAITRLIHELGLSLAVPIQEFSVKQSEQGQASLQASDGFEAFKRLGLEWKL